jgi:proteasome lid subunit RPN8/RPN11
MNSFIAPTTPRPSQPKFLCAEALWQRLLVALRERGQQGRRESGAFLLGRRSEDQARICDFALYDDLDPHSLDRGIVHFDGRYYGALWQQCQRTGLTVVADVHTHPFDAEQSASDRAHPMIATAGHLALILPRFAMGVAPREEIGMYRYLGARRWYNVPARERAGFLGIDNAGAAV